MNKKSLVKSFLINEKESIWLFFILLAFYIFFQLKSVYGGDSGDFLSAAATWGVAHPPGYPLYTLLASGLHHLSSFSTPAFRVAFLSSVPAALTIIFLYKILSSLVNKKISLFIVLFLAFCYPFWLYAEVVEVFSLNNFFLVLLTYLVLRLDFGDKYFSWFFFFLGLALSHHQTILFLYPGLIYIFKRKNYFRKLKLKYGLFFILGLIPYLYLPLAALKNPAINWNNPVNITNFFNLITRKMYGTFMANQGILQDYRGRFFNILAFGRFLLADFNLLGIVLILLGIISTFSIKNQSRKIIAKFLLINFLSYVFFIFYASFNIFGDFLIATFERFLLAPYIFAVILIAMGANAILQFIKKAELNHKKMIISLFFLVLLIVFPVWQLKQNYKKISILKNDMTAEYFAQDILDSLVDGGIIFTHSDTTHFDTEYLFYSRGYKINTVKYINVFMLPAGYYQNYLKKTYPDLKMNEQQKDPYDWQIFLSENYNTAPIYSIPAKDIVGYESVPFGLTFRYFKKEDLPSINQIIAINDNLWQNYHNPLSGSLAKYKNLFLADVVNYYKDAAKRYGEYLINYNQFDKAEEYLKKSFSYGINDIELNVFLGRAYLGQKKCVEAENQFTLVKKVLPDNPFPDAYLRQVYLDCYQDEQKAKDFLNSCLDKENESFPQLKDL